MNLVQKIQNYGDAHHSKWLDILRMMLGIILLAKGMYYISNTDDLSRILASGNSPVHNMIIVHYVAFAHLLGGILITIGLVTRIAILFQLPVLTGAILFIHAYGGLLSADSNLLLAVLVLLLLIFFFIYGSGPWSVDALLERNRKDWDGPDL